MDFCLTFKYQCWLYSLDPHDQKSHNNCLKSLEKYLYRFVLGVNYTCHSLTVKNVLNKCTIPFLTSLKDFEFDTFEL